jgi:hypothetical protein
MTGIRCVAVAALALAACGRPRQPDPPLSARASESALARSGIPGAKGIDRALRVSDSADARRRREDSISREKP